MGAAGPVRLIGVVDYDPSGALIAQAFRDQLVAVGLLLVGVLVILLRRGTAKRGEGRRDG